MTNYREVVRYPELKQRYNVPFSFEHLCRLEKQDRFPRRLKLSYRCVAWYADEIEAWLASRRQVAA
jgi:prophage regulatory protein